VTDTLPGVRTRQLIEEMRRDGERRDREAQEREREREKRSERERKRHEAFLADMRREAQERHEAQMADMRRQERLTNAFIQEGRDVTRAMLAELRDHGERMRLGFDATYGALTDLSREIRSWRDEGGSSATA